MQEEDKEKELMIHECKASSQTECLRPKVQVCDQ